MEKIGIQEAVDRIRQMERCFEMLLDAADCNPAVIPEDALLQSLLQRLTQYYESGRWLRDYELDEKGLLPQNLKRGVLSQDAVYAFLDRVRDLQNSEVQDESSIIN